MDDLISRDDAIRELSGVCSTWEDDAKVQEIVMAIPSTKPTGDLISRADAIEAIQNAYCKPCKERGDDHNEVRCRVCEYDNAIIQIDALPSAEAVSREEYDQLEALYDAIRIYDSSAEAVHGEWGHMIAHGTDGSHWYEYECSHCGEVVLRPYNFCPNCGTMMYKDGDDTTGESL